MSSKQKSPIFPTQQSLQQNKEINENIINKQNILQKAAEKIRQMDIFGGIYLMSIFLF